MKVKHVFINFPQRNKNPLARADIMLGDDGGDAILILKGWSLMTGANGMWVSPPQDMVEKDGEKNWYPKILFVKKEGEFTPESEALRNHIQEEVIAAYNSAIDSNDPAPQKQQAKPTQSPFKNDLGF